MAVDDAHWFVGFDGYQKVIDSADVVLIACASKFHPMYAEAAIKAGKHVFVEKPHAIDPVGCRRMDAVCDLAKQKNLSIVSGLQSRFDNGWQETVKRIHDGAIGDVVAMQSMFLRGPYRSVDRDPELTEIQYQFSNWYHFRWLSGDDVPQSLVHNVDRMSWIMKEEMPTWAFGLAGRSASFGEVYGDMFDHHTVVYEYKSGARLYALCRTEVGCYDNSGDIIMGTKGQCHLDKCEIRGETNWKFEGQRNNPYLAEQKALIDSVRDGKPINSGYHMVNSTMIGILGQIACYTGKDTTWEAARDADLQLRAGAGGVELRDGAADQARPRRQLPVAHAGRDEAAVVRPANPSGRTRRWRDALRRVRLDRASGRVARPRRSVALQPHMARGRRVPLTRRPAVISFTYKSTLRRRESGE